MRHVFIINPKAGKFNRSSDFIAQIHVAFEKREEPYEIILTEYVGHAADIAAVMLNCRSKYGFMLLAVTEL